MVYCGPGDRLMDPPDRDVNPGELWGSRAPRFWAGGRGRVVKYYYILSCTGSMFESGDFLREIE